MAKDTNATKPVATAKPGTPDEAGKKAKKAKKSRPIHPAVQAALAKKDGKVESLPSDFDFAKHAPIKKKEWAEEPAFLEYKAKECDWKAAKFRAEADESRKLGSKKARNAASRLKKMTGKMAELKAQLAAQGVDVEKIIAEAMSDE